MSVTNKFYLNLLYGFLLGKTFILRTKKEIKLVIKIVLKTTKIKLIKTK